jgi:hypothetical protein
MLDKLLPIRHIGDESFRQNKLTPIPIETAPSKYKLGAIVEVLKVGVGKSSSLPADRLPAVEQCNTPAY